MNAGKCYPRLATPQAADVWETVRTRSLEELAALASAATTAGADFYPIATARCTDSDLQSLRSAVLAEARKHGFPSVEQSRHKTAFDQAVAKILYQEMNILAADAASRDVWNFINLRLLPDVMIWRYGSRNRDSGRWVVSEERLYQFNRTTFGRLWWRARLLGPDLAGQLGEDESVQIVERTRVGGYAPLATAIAQRHLSSDSEGSRMELLRDAMKRIVRRLAVVSVFFLTDQQISALVDDVFVESEGARKRLAEQK